MLAADTLGSYGTLARYTDLRRIRPVGASTLVAASGEYSDFQYLMDLLSELDTGEAVLADGARMKAPEVHAYLTRVLSNRRLKVDPLWNTLLVAGPDAAGEPRLGYVDLRGTAFCDDYAATGYGAYMALPLIRERWAPGMDEGAARALLEDCMRVLWARDCKALNRIQIAKVTRAGETAVSEPYVVHATWDYAAFSVNGAAPHAPDSSGPGARVPHAPDPPPVPGPHGAFTLHPASGSLEDFTAHEGVRAFVLAVVARQRPRNVLLYTGAPAQHAAVLEQLVSSGALIPVADRPNSFAAFSVPTDVARVEARTFIACAAAEDAGVLNNWREPGEMRACLHKTLDGASAGRTLFVVPFALGPLGGDGGAPGGAAPAPAAPAGAASASASASAVVGVQTTDSGYVVASLAIMTRAGAPALAALGARGRDAFFVRATHSLAAPLAAPGAADVPWPCAASAADVAIAHFPETREIVSTGSGYGGNAILAKKSFALRIASVLGRDDGWHAEHAFILGLQPPGGRRKRYIIGAFPSGCGKTNTAMLSLPPAYAAKGWTATTVGDDIAWLRWADDGRGGLQLRATNPEFGIFGVAPGTSERSNGAALAATRSPAGALFTNVALTPGARDVWWEGLTRAPPPRLTSWLRREWLPRGAPGAEGGDAAHANARFTAPLSAVPCVDAAWDDPAGVPVDAILLGGRRADTTPLVAELPTWDAGVLAGATLHSETTAAAEGARGALRWDPFSMRPFIGYDAGSYFAHWLAPARDARRALPAFVAVNWFRRGADGAFLWPGFGDNMRVLEWVVARAEARDGERPPPPSVETALGFAPDVARGGLDLDGSGVPPAAAASLLALDAGAWRRELARGAAALASVGPRLPRELLAAHAALAARVEAGAAGRELPPFPGRAPGRGRVA